MSSITATTEIFAANHLICDANDAIILRPKGEFIAGGTTSIVERLPSGDVIKTPWRGGVRENDCQKEILVEAKIYQKLGDHPRLVKMKHWDANAFTLTLEYMPNGTLKEYTKSHAKEISLAQKRRWILQAADALTFLHSAGIIHCDIGPHNFLLDVDLNLKISDFSGSSLDGSLAMVCPGSRYAAPDPNWKPGKIPVAGEDIFALGSTIYHIIEGKAPFEDLSDDEVEQNFLNGVFPELNGLPYADLIALCWQQKVTALDIIQHIDRLSDSEYEEAMV
ncbi:serine threonine protein kinase [Fusarium langsethiae]|uniref:Serine threonine protein kinase n=2 Tax=Fusarium sambucinum species complex TaxID=569360 RepID=A0A0M9ESV6_FUSLA|nr:hypothetical protein FPOAC1_007263 [Fusarium poae]KPA38940.1 serine threonine protein kinase [Fusarium langsethiae]CAF3454599.1 unnamed protein product [Fusarium graminearum]KAG8673944.1 hypothetical protein FPOAC1_007263 [Fusarium poae]OBS20568.1 hypothetical protein FPOA_06926 [Fusarium poae]GKU06611.1 unnamed protein product [Fusarium langsethiae]